MREIKFRGKGKYDGRWVYGNLCYCCDVGETCIGCVSVESDTVGQFTNFYDNSEKEIYEGDIVKAAEKLYKVEFHNAQFELRPVDSSYVDFYITLEKARRIGLRLEVVGNVFDNSELLRREDNAGN